MRDEKVVPKWACTFRCRRVKPGTPLAVLQKVAGRQQARAEGVMRNTLAAKARFLLREHQNALAAGKQNITRTELLTDVYMKTGCSESSDGTVVSYVLPASLSCPGNGVIVHDTQNCNFFPFVLSSAVQLMLTWDTVFFSPTGIPEG